MHYKENTMYQINLVLAALSKTKESTYAYEIHGIYRHLLVYKWKI